MRLGNFQHRKRAPSGEQGYILLILGLFVTLLAIASLANVHRVVQQIRRDREEEMIHRGAQYARAIRKFVKKNGAYPTSFDQLEDTNHIRYLRRRYKDPFAPDGEWRPLHITDVPFLAATQAGPQQSGQQTGQQTGTIGPGSSGGMGGTGQTGLQSPPMGGQQFGQALRQSMGQSAAPQNTGGNTGGTGLSNTGDTSSGLGGPTSTLGSGTTSRATMGAGAIVGVASSADIEGIKEFNQKKKYKEWYFVYDPAAESLNPASSGLINGPYTGKVFTATTNVGTPAGQLASPNQPRGIGQPIGTGFSGTSSTPSSSTTPNR